MKNNILYEFAGSPRNHCLAVVEGFECPNDPRSHVVGVFFSPGRITQGKLLLGEGLDKEWFERFL